MIKNVIKIFLKIIHLSERRRKKMSKNTCEHPERKPKNGKCSKELIKKCHGNKKEHPCDQKSTKENN